MYPHALREPMSGMACLPPMRGGWFLWKICKRSSKTRSRNPSRRGPEGERSREEAGLRKLQGQILGSSHHNNNRTQDSKKCTGAGPVAVLAFEPSQYQSLAQSLLILTTMDHRVRPYQQFDRCKIESRNTREPCDCSHSRLSHSPAHAWCRDVRSVIRE